jgi:ribonuclease J
MTDRTNNNFNRRDNTPNASPVVRTVSRGAAMRAQKRNVEMASKIANEYQDASANKLEKRANVIDNSPRLKVIGLGGMDGGGSKNMLLLEYLNDAIVIDSGNDLGVDLPGINYGIADITYLESIRNKLRGYVITHGHLDHIGGLPHILPKVPAPVYGSKFTIGRVEEIFENFGLPMPEGFALRTVVVNESTHERIKLGNFFIELIRVTHSIPGATSVVVDTPVGRVFVSGDFRFDPQPLDHERTDTQRLEEISREGVLALLLESTTTDRAGRTPSESVIEPTYIQLLDSAPGRVFIAIFSTNINRIQMIINAAVHHGRKIALDGRSMMSTLEMAVRHGFVKVPKGTFIPIASANNLPDDKVVVICTGGQGEPSSALMRMSTGDHRSIKMKPRDTVIISSSPIPYTGNDALIATMVDDLMRNGVHVFQHVTHDIDHIGPLHVSGHASMDEYKELINIVKPKFFIPVYGSYSSKQRNIEMAVEEGIPRDRTYNAENGDVLALTSDKMEHIGQVPHGVVLVDQTGAIVSNVVVKDRIMMAQDGLVMVVLTIDRKTGASLTSPDIISRGFIYMRDNEDLMTELRNELRRAVQQRFKRVDLDRFKQEIKEHVTHFLFEKTQRSPIVIPVINVIGGKSPNSVKTVVNGKTAEETAKEEVVAQARRFAQMRRQLLGQDTRADVDQDIS